LAQNFIHFISLHCMLNASPISSSMFALIPVGQRSNCGTSHATFSSHLLPPPS
jgi:hypothetical protein